MHSTELIGERLVKILMLTPTKETANLPLTQQVFDTDWGQKSLRGIGEIAVRAVSEQLDAKNLGAMLFKP